jgi:hypothetical protein
MKKIIVILVAALAAFTLTAAVSASNSVPSQGTISFESASMPVLNFTMPLQRAEGIFSLLPGNIRDICTREYKVVKGKSLSSSRFTHEGVSVRVRDNGPTITVELSTRGYKVTADNVTMEELDRLFGGE